MKCNRDCFNCKYDDCINDQMEYGDYAELNEIEKDNREYKTPKKQREYFKRYYAEKREHRLENGRRYYETHGEERREYSRRYSKENKERKAAYLREWRRKRREKSE
jgi:hypothetical protein